jgi:hypothetical protein
MRTSIPIKCWMRPKPYGAEDTLNSLGRHRQFGVFQPNTATSVVLIEVFALSIRNITLILQRRASKLSCRQERSRIWCVVSFPIAIRRCALSCSSRQRCHPWLSCRHRSSRSPCQIVVFQSVWKNAVVSADALLHFPLNMGLRVRHILRKLCPRLGVRCAIVRSGSSDVPV